MKTKTHFTEEQKQELIAKVQGLMGADPTLSIRAACEQVGLRHQNYTRWTGGKNRARPAKVVVHAAAPRPAIKKGTSATITGRDGRCLALVGSVNDVSTLLSGLAL